MNSKIGSKSLTLMVLWTAGFGVFSLFIHLTLQQTTSRGSLDPQIMGEKDLVEDILVPPTNAIECYLTILEIVDPKSVKDLDQLEKKLHSLQAAYKSRLQFWKQTLPPGQIKDLLVSKLSPPAIRLFRLADEQLLPLIENHEFERAATLANGELTTAFRQHRASLEELTTLLRAGSAQREQNAERNTPSTSIPPLFLFGTILVGILVASVVYPLENSQHRAQQIAKKAIVELKALVSNGDGRIVEQFPEGQEIKDLKSSDEELRVAKQAAILSFFENSALRKAVEENELVSVADLNGRILSVNDRICKISGYSREELIGKDHRILSSGTHPKEFWQSMWRTIIAGQTWRGEVCNRAKDGSCYWVDSIIAPLKGIDGTIEKFVSIRREITRQKADEHALASLSRVQQAILDNSAFAIISTTTDGIIEVFNPAAERLLGYDAKDLIGRSTPNVFHLEAEVVARAKQFSEELGELVTPGFETFIAKSRRKLPNEHEWTYVRKDGRFLTVLLSITSLVDDAGKISGYLGLAMDMSSRKDAELSLKNTLERLDEARRTADAANQAKSEFLANMSHEIRTPLTAILGFSDILRNDGVIELAPIRRIQAIDTIRHASQHLLAVINDILDLSKIEAGKLNTEQIEMSLPSLLAEVDTYMRPPLQGKNVELRMILETPIPDRIISDPTRQRQILMNLVGNASKFTEAGHVIVRVRVNRSDASNSLQIEVEDTGTGMTSEQAQVLFRPFSQADTSVSRRYGGTGLGLTISRRLAALMGGDVRLLHSQLGRGSSFMLELPLVPAQNSIFVNELLPSVDKSSSRIKVVTAKCQGRRILLAEDGIANQNLISFYLQQAGAEVEVADNGRIALEHIEAAASNGHPFDLLVTDMQMPEVDGYALAKILRESGNCIPIIALTAHAMGEDRQKCLAAGCDDYLTKPIDKFKLSEICCQWIDGRGDEAPSQTSKPSTDAPKPTARSETKTENRTPENVLVSELANDVEVIDLIDKFLSNLGPMVSDITEFASTKQFEKLVWLSHQLKGAGGGYGYPAISDAAKRVELCAKSELDVEAIQLAVGELSQLCQRAIAGRESLQLHVTNG